MVKIYEKLEKNFKEKFNKEAQYRLFSPGRINLIGEHTDYNGGHVFPAAISLGTFGVASSRNDQTVKLFSNNFTKQGTLSFSLSQQIVNNKKGTWDNYVKGVTLALKKEGFKINHGFELLIEGNLPGASGLSSSASLEMLIGVLLNKIFNLKATKMQLAKAGQTAENDFVGVNSGIMDQFAVGFGQKNKAIFLDTRTSKYEIVPAQFKDNVILIMNTNKNRALTGSKYNERRSECEKALKKLQAKLNIQYLCDLNDKQFEENKNLINDKTLIKRAKHVVYENQRAILAKKILAQGDLKKFGELLNASHKSLKEDYEVTGLELDTLAETTQKQDGALGARMTGAGFGGCAIALVNKNSVDQIKKTVGDVYLKKVGYPASFYVAEISDGAKVVA